MSAIDVCAGNSAEQEKQSEVFFWLRDETVFGLLALAGTVALFYLSGITTLSAIAVVLWIGCCLTGGCLLKIRNRRLSEVAQLSRETERQQWLEQQRRKEEELCDFLKQVLLLWSKQVDTSKTQTEDCCDHLLRNASRDSQTT